MDPTDQERKGPHSGAPGGDDGATHANGRPGEDDRWLRSVVENSSEIVTLVDPDGTLHYANPAWERALGYDTAGSIGKMNVLDHVHPDDLSHVLEETEEALAEGGVTTNEAQYRFRHRDGSWRWMESVGTYLLDDPAVGGVVVVSRDVTERKEAEEALRRSEAEIFSILESITDGFFALDHELSFTYVNPKAELLLNRSREDLVGERIWEDPTFYPQYRKALAEGRTAAFEGYYPPREAWYDVRAYPSGSGLSVYFQDITERKAAEEKIRFQSGLLGAVGESVIALDVAGRVLYWNEAAEEMYGWSSEEIMGRRLMDVVIPEGLRGRAEDISAQVREGRSWTGQFEVRRRDGVTFPVEGNSTPVFGEDGSLIGVIGVIRDITERKQAEKRLREAEEGYRTLVEQVPAITFIHHQKPGEFSGTMYVSPQVEAVLGYTQEEYTSDPEFWKTILHPDDRERVLATYERTGDTGEPFDLEFRMLAKDGRAVWLRESGTLVRDEDGRGQVWHGVMFDITELKRIEGELRETEERYRTLVERIPAIVYVQEPGEPSRTTYISPQYEEILGYSLEECLSDPEHWTKILHPDDREKVLAEDRRTNDSGEAFSMEYRQFAKDGRTVWIRDEATMVRDEEGEPLYWLGVQTDVTERKEAEERYRTLVERMPAVTYVEEVGDSSTLYMSPQIEDLLGYPQEAWLGSPDYWKECIHPEDQERVLAEAARSNATGEPFRTEYRLLHRDGDTVWVHDEAVLVDGPGERSKFWQGVLTNITGRKALEERLEHQALHDSLTDLPNRRLFTDRLGHALERSRRRGGVAVLFMDLDDFKVVNDSLGHEAGDLLLVVLAQRLGRCLRPEDTLARFGGDEFVVLLEDVEDPAEAVRVAERITDELRRPFVLEGRELFVRTSVGIALGTARTKSAEDLLRDADTAMYRAKEEGGTFRLFDPDMYERALGRLELENDLRKAIEREEFVIHYQPIVSLQTGGLWGLEALVRWDHPERGLLDPDEFVPVAEESGLVVPMGELVLTEACHRAAEWQRAFPRNPPLAMSVNLSGRQLRRPDLHEAIGQALTQTGLPASSLGLDITETVYISALDTNTAALDRLTALGVRVSLDDFGSGYSSLSYLKRLPANILKIDKSFTKGLGVEIEDTAIVQTVVDLAHILGMEVVAEGVEIEEQETLLKEMGCDFAQGFYFAGPLPAQDIPALLSSYTLT